MKRYVSAIFVITLLWSVLYTPLTILAHEADGIYYNQDLVKGLNNYRDVKLFVNDNGIPGDSIPKPTSSMTVTVNGSKYKDTGNRNEDDIQATVSVDTPINIDFDDSYSAYGFADVGLQVTNGTGDYEPGFGTLPHMDGHGDTAYAGQYPFSWGTTSFTPTLPGTYKIYGEVMADIDKANIYSHWDAWSDNGSHSEYSDMLAHSTPPDGEVKAYPVKWYFEVVTIKVVPRGTLTVRYKDNITHEEIAAPKIDTGYGLPNNPKAELSTGIPVEYNSTPTNSMFWYGTDDEASGQTKKTYSYPITVNLTEDQPDATVYYFYDLKPPENGRIYYYQVDIGSKNIIAGKIIDVNSLPQNKTVKDTDMTAPANSTFSGSQLLYSKPESMPDSNNNVYEKEYTANLSENHKEAWVYYYYKFATTPTPTPTSTNTPPPTATPTPKLPPVAVIQSADEVMMGDDIDIRSNSHDSDGEIVKHEWTAPTVKIPILDWGNTTWFDYFGVATIKLKVTDNDGLTGSTSKKINILPPVPTAVITYTGKLKENYKITIDSVNSTSPKRYPIDTTKTVWKITAVSGCSDSEIKYLGTLSGMRSKDFLVKKQGQIKVELTVTNTAGYSDTASILLDIQPNLSPVAQFFVPSQSIRENVDSQGRRYGETTVYDSSYSPDGDKIIYRKYYCRYDKDNDDNFEEEALNMFYEGAAKEATLRYYNDQAVGWCRYDIYVEEDLLEKDANGNYINTIPDFIASEDIKSASTFYLK